MTRERTIMPEFPSDDKDGVIKNERKFSAGLLLGLAGLNSFDGALAAMKRGIPYECIRGALSKDLRHFFETPIDDLIK